MPRCDKIDSTNEHVLLKLTVVDPRRDVYFAAKRANRRNNLFARLLAFVSITLRGTLLLFLFLSLCCGCSLERVVSFAFFSYLQCMRYFGSLHFCCGEGTETQELVKFAPNKGQDLTGR